MYRPLIRIRRRRRAARRLARPDRKGVASVLAMMFLVIFGSLAAAMAVVAQGNLRTAASSLQVSRAMSAADSGLVFAARRLREESRRFVVEKGVISPSFGEELWLGTYDAANDGVTVLAPSYDPEVGEETGIGLAEAIYNAHAFDGQGGEPSYDAENGVVIAPGIPLDTGGGSAIFNLRYDVLVGVADPTIRITAEGIDGDVSRVLRMDFRINKRIEYAILSPNRIMIGKNVMIEGPLGTRYGIVGGELDTENGDPLVMRSDFYYLSDTLDDNLDLFYQAVVDYDVDGDARLRPDHPTESLGLSGNPALADQDGDEYVDDFDLFLGQFDADADGMVVYDADLAYAAGLGSLSEEFDVDVQLARLIDESRPDRDGDGEITTADYGLGYQDGVLDGNDLYAKVAGNLAFKVARSAWEVEHGESYQTVVEGAIRPGIDEAPVTFEVDDEELLEITTEMVTNTRTWFEGQVPAPVDRAMVDPPVDPAVLADEDLASGTYTAPSDDSWEPVPYGAPGAYDFYQRPVYEDMVFRDVRIPMGNNGLYKNCTFIGVTYVEAESDNTHPHWNVSGAVTPIEVDEDGDGTPDSIEYHVYRPEITVPDPEGSAADVNTRWNSNSIRFENCTFLGSLAGDRVSEYTHWRNKVQMTGTCRFYLDPNDEDLLQQDDAATLQGYLESIPVDDRQELGKSSILMPGWSVDVGNFNNEQGGTPDDTPTIKLKGTMLAGILDVRGTADVHGTLLMTFRPTAGEGPLYFGGQPDTFNTTIGYFGPDDGDNESAGPGDPGFNGFGEIRLRYNPDALLPDGIPWPIHVEAVPDSYYEGGTF